MKHIKKISFALLISIVGFGCSSGADNHADEKAQDGQEAPKTIGTGKHEDQGSVREPGKDVHAEDVPTGTGTDSAKVDTGVKKGKWPTQGRPFS
jgi:hypothetical protein